MSDLHKAEQFWDLMVFALEAEKAGIKSSDIVACCTAADGDFTRTRVRTYEQKIRERAFIAYLRDTIETKTSQDTLEFVKQFGHKLSREVPKTLGQGLDDYVVGLSNRKQYGVITGMICDDVCALTPGSLTSLLARTSVGKSALSLNLAVYAAHFNQQVLFCTAEMTAKDLFDRTASMLTGIPMQRIRFGKTDKTEQLRIRRELSAIENSLSIHEVMSQTPAMVCSSIRAYAATRKLDFVVIDYLQILRMGANNQNRTIVVGEAVNMFKRLAQELGVAIFMMSQVTREATKRPDKEPAVEDARDSGEIEQGSDNIWILNRKERDDDFGTLRIAKQRNGVANVVIQLRYNPSTQVYSDAPMPAQSDFLKRYLAMSSDTNVSSEPVKAVDIQEALDLVEQNVVAAPTPAKPKKAPLPESGTKINWHKPMILDDSAGLVEGNI